MSAVFGIDADDAKFSPDHHALYLNRFAPDGTDTLHALQHLFADDVIFLKHYTPQSGLDVTAIGVVQPRHPGASYELACIPIRWVWEGDCHIRNPEESNCLRSKSLYEEYDIEVQRELLDLMPVNCQVAPEW